MAARQARGGLDRAIRAIALTQVRIEEARFALTRFEDAVERRRELSDEVQALHERLRQAASAVAQSQRISGVRPEQVVILLKDIVASNALDPFIESSIRRRVVEWGIDAYYAA